MITDRQGNALPGATAESADFYTESVESFNLYRGDPFAPLERAIQAAPQFAMAHIFKAYLYATATEPAASLEAQKIVVHAKTLPLDARAESHIAVLTALMAGNWTRAAVALDYHNAHYPHDLIGIQCGHLMDFYRACARDLRDRLARVLPQWSAEIPGYSLLLGMYAFGLEECADYERAEEYGQTATELEPFDCWAHHAVSHVMEMQGRAEDGIDWMASREAYWAGEDNFFRVHNWWHKALYHLDLGQTEQALSIYDGPIRGLHSSMALDLVDASALLWRLNLLGCDVSDRWQELARAWEQHADGRHYPFNDWHGVMAFLGAGRDDEVERIANTIRAASSNDTDVARWAWQTGLPLLEGFTAFWHGDYHRAAEKLHGARFIANSFGGSHAQRDITDWTLTEAALRAGMKDLAEALASERLALKPDSAVNRLFLQRAVRSGGDH
ncbi:tetratricopeptide repeat protein [Microbulbifer magnicolonia]|uniref:tetratricopeptide repeat protein n=1 Tax=Microbulbifer magnicolonia TaxID=3109744 RepID=UPI002B409E50|nr:tetratricopeptide repeat protein [Microbulbifer sp. GG15]